MTQMLINPRPSTLPVTRYTGHVTYIYAYDIAYEMTRAPVTTLLGQPIAHFQIDSNKRAPRHLSFYRPQMVRLPPLERIGPQGPVRIERQAKLFPVGAISIIVRVPFEVANITELVAYHDLKFNNGTTVHDEVISMAEDIRNELNPLLIRPVKRLSGRGGLHGFLHHFTAGIRRRTARRRRRLARGQSPASRGSPD